MRVERTGGDIEREIILEIGKNLVDREPIVAHLREKKEEGQRFGDDETRSLRKALAGDIIHSAWICLDCGNQGGNHREDEEEQERNRRALRDALADGEKGLEQSGRTTEISGTRREDQDEEEEHYSLLVSSRDEEEGEHGSHLWITLREEHFLRQTFHTQGRGSDKIKMKLDTVVPERGGALVGLVIGRTYLLRDWKTHRGKAASPAQARPSPMRMRRLGPREAGREAGRGPVA